MKRKSTTLFAPVMLVILAVSQFVAGQSETPGAATDGVGQQSIASADTSKSRDLIVSPEGQKHYEAGVRLYGSAKFSEALAEFKEATKVLPNDAQAHFMQGMSEARLQLYKDAVESFKRAVRIKPEWPDAQFRLGIVSHVTGRRVLAIDAYTSLVKQNSPLANILYRCDQGREEPRRRCARGKRRRRFLVLHGKAYRGRESPCLRTGKDPGPEGNYSGAAAYSCGPQSLRHLSHRSRRHSRHPASQLRYPEVNALHGSRGRSDRLSNGWRTDDGCRPDD